MTVKSGENETAKTKKLIPDAFLRQIAVLKSLSPQALSKVAHEPSLLQINEITERAGLNDEKETQRYLFILEGQKLVTPHPVGDFTSRTWTITKDGIRALKSISENMFQ